jgi:YegS/Rv2252/BmrU family lipid kinase
MSTHTFSNRMIAILINPLAGKGKAKKVLSLIENNLTERQIHFKTFSSARPEELEIFSEVWLIGGDGTLNHFINKYSDIQVPIALFKGGSGNDFAWKLYGNKTVEDYLKDALDGISKRVDAGICNGRYFINGVGIGFDGEVVKAMGAKRFLSAGFLAYLAVVLRKILSYSEKEITITWNSHVLKEQIFMVSVANGSRYGGGFLVAPQASLEDGNLDLIYIKKIPVIQRFFFIRKVSKGEHLSLPIVAYSRIKKIIVSAPEILPAHLDGELMEAKDFTIEIIPKKFLFYC